MLATSNLNFTDCCHKHPLCNQIALLKLTDDVRRVMYRKQLTAVLLFDFSKAFNSVCYTTLLAKLQLLGFSGGVLSCTPSNLSNCLQVIRAEGLSETFSLSPLNKGVLHSLVLDSLLFSLFVAELQTILEELSGAAEFISVRNHSILKVGKTKAMVFGATVYV